MVSTHSSMVTCKHTMLKYGDGMVPHCGFDLHFSDNE